MINIDPDDRELRDAINLCIEMKSEAVEADKNWDRLEVRGYVYGQQYNRAQKAQKDYEKALIKLALIVLDSL